jgi:hypothetical protein
MHLPRMTTRKLMLAMVVIAAMFWLMRLSVAFFTQTRYVEGYDESRFRMLAPGLSAREVEGIMGPPFAKTPWGTNRENWQYSGKVAPTLYHRRWVIMTAGKVSEVVCEIAGF